MAGTYVAPWAGEGTKVTPGTPSPTKPMMSVEDAPLFAGLNAAALRTLRSRSVERRFATDEVLFIAGAPSRGLFVVLEGSVRVVRTRAGRQHVIHTEAPGGTLGEVPLYVGGGYPATAVAAAPTRCAVIGREAVGAMIANDPQLAWRLLERLATRVRGLVDRIDALATQDVAARLAAHLLARVESDGKRHLTALGGTQMQLAEELGTVREVVVRQLRVLQQAGVLRRAGRGRYEILRIDALRAAAGVET